MTLLRSADSQRLCTIVPRPSAAAMLTRSSWPPASLSQSLLGFRLEAAGRLRPSGDRQRNRQQCRRGHASSQVLQTVLSFKTRGNTPSAEAAGSSSTVAGLRREERSRSCADRRVGVAVNIVPPSLMMKPWPRTKKDSPPACCDKMRDKRKGQRRRAARSAAAKEIYNETHGLMSLAVAIRINSRGLT